MTFSFSCRPVADAGSVLHGSYFTGDIGHADADSDINVTGRVDGMKITGGENVLRLDYVSLDLNPHVRSITLRAAGERLFGL